MKLYEKWYTGTVRKGLQLSASAGYPTINLDPSILQNDIRPGVYAANVTYAGTRYHGALYFGPKYIEDKEIQTLEIFVFTFNATIYGENVLFKLMKFIRPPIKFSSLREVTDQLDKDIQHITTFYTNTPS